MGMGKKIGSSYFALKGRLDFKEEVCCIRVAVTHSRDHLNAVVCSHERGYAEWVSRIVDDAVEVATKAVGDVQDTLVGHCLPHFPSGFRLDV